MSRLSSKTIIVTGAARGIGKGLAERISAEGGSLLLVDKDPDVETVARDIGCRFLVADICDPHSAKAAMAMIADQFGRLDGLVNNAGIVPEGDILETSDETFASAIEVNLTAPFVWSRAAIPVMLERGGGSIVNISTIEAAQVRPKHLAYVVSKSGLNSLTRSIACDFGRQGIRCNTISPGSIKSELFDAYAKRYPGVEEKLISLNYAGRLGTIEEVAAACAYLLSDDTGFLNGHDLIIDGARTIAT
jgi:NAD(P)-dependent dehydrogenase (short-subunit alcohol dehydrogenase family)